MSALETLAELQADATTRRSTPSRERSSTSCAPAGPRRSGSAATTGRSTRHRCTSCSSSEVWRWTGDAELALALRAPALGGPCLDRRLRRPRRRRLRRVQRARRGLENQSWKDSGRLPALPRRPVRGASDRAGGGAGYVYDAKRRLAEIARHAWAEEPLATRLEAEADELAGRFDDAFWVPDRGGYHALALDRDKQQVDALCSNVGHLPLEAASSRRNESRPSSTR